MFSRSLFVLLYFFFWPLCFLFFFDIRFLIAPLVSSNSSFNVIICAYTQIHNRSNSEVIRSRWSKERHTIQSPQNDKRKNNDLQSITQKTINWLTRTPLKRGMNYGAPEGWTVPALLVAPSSYSCCKPCDKSWMWIGQDCDYANLLNVYTIFWIWLCIEYSYT